MSALDACCLRSCAQLKGKAGSLADANGGQLVDELRNAKEKAPYVQPGPVRSTPDILNLDEPGKVIRKVCAPRHVPAPDSTNHARL